MQVLLIEPNQLLGRVLRRGLEEESFTVDVACCGPGQNPPAPTAAYDVIVLGLSRPLEGCPMAVQSWPPAHLSAPVLVLAPPRGPGDRAWDPGARVIDYLAKPFALDELLARLRALIRRGHQVKGPCSLLPTW